MKTIKIIIILTLSLLILSCSNSSETPQETPSKTLTFANNNSVNITDATSANSFGVGESEISIPNTGIITNKNLVTVELTLEHPEKRDLSISIIAPNSTEKIMVYRLGPTPAGPYVASNKLRFSATFTNAISNSNAVVAAGDYGLSLGSNFTAGQLGLEPMFSYLQNKQIQGIWKLKVNDFTAGNLGRIVSWKIIIADGAIQ
jgi:subtilisin-like proprotein convertase family protein